MKRMYVSPPLPKMVTLKKNRASLSSLNIAFHQLREGGGRLSNPAKLGYCKVHSAPGVVQGTASPTACKWLGANERYRDGLDWAGLRRLQAERSTWDELDGGALAGGVTPATFADAHSHVNSRGLSLVTALRP